MALSKQILFLLASLCLTFQVAIAAKYEEWDDLPDCAV
jgi:hypothetical protein